MPFDNIEIPTTLVNNNFSECRDVGDGESVVIYTGILPFYGKAAPLRRNPVGIRTKEFQIDSKVAMRMRPQIVVKAEIPSETTPVVKIEEPLEDRPALETS